MKIPLHCKFLCLFKRPLPTKRISASFPDELANKKVYKNIRRQALDAACIVNVGDALVGGEVGRRQLQELSAISRGGKILASSLKRFLHLPAMSEVNSEVCL